MQRLNLMNDSVKNMMEPVLQNIANNDPKSLVRAGAIEALGRYRSEAYKTLFLKSMNDSSYSIAGKSLLALVPLDTATALEKARIMSDQKIKGALSDAVTNVLFTCSGEEDFDNLAAGLTICLSEMKSLQFYSHLPTYLKKVNNTENFRKGIDMIVKFRDTIPEQYRQMLAPYLNGMILNGIASSKQSKGMTDQADYVRSKLPSKPKTAEAAVPAEALRKYAGDYDIEGTSVKITLKDDKTLSLVIPEQPDMELIPVSKDLFGIKFMEGYTLAFTENNNGEVTDFLFKTPDGEVQATRKK